MKMTDDIAYFCGLWIAEGSYDESIGRISITCGDDGVGEDLHGLDAATGQLVDQEVDGDVVLFADHVGGTDEALPDEDDAGEDRAKKGETA